MRKFSMKRGLQILTQMMRLVVGVHDYDTYVQHMRNYHPNKKVMSKKEFYQYCVTARYPSKDKAGTGCPC